MSGGCPYCAGTDCAHGHGEPCYFEELAFRQAQEEAERAHWDRLYEESLQAAESIGRFARELMSR